MAKLGAVAVGGGGGHSVDAVRLELEEGGAVDAVAFWTEALRGDDAFIHSAADRSGGNAYLFCHLGDAVAGPYHALGHVGHIGHGKLFVALDQKKTVTLPMGRIGKDKKMIGITTPEDLTKIIDARAEALGWSRAKFALAILEQWQQEGAKPVNKIDATMAPEVMAKLMKTKALKTNAS